MKDEKLKAPLLAGSKLIGMFSRLRDPDVVETLAASPLNFVVLDAEHGSLNRSDISRIVYVARSKSLPILVRVPDDGRVSIQHATSVGASGVVVPHVQSAAQAEAVVSFVRATAVERAYAGQGRDSDMRRRPWPDVQDEARDQSLLILQIDESGGFESIAEIAAVSGVDAIFIGSLSLALSMGVEPGGAAAIATMKAICEACRAAGRRVGMHLQNAADVPKWMGQGVNLFVVGNDYSLLLEGAKRACASFGVQDRTTT